MEVYILSNLSLFMEECAIETNIDIFSTYEKAKKEFDIRVKYIEENFSDYDEEDLEIEKSDDYIEIFHKDRMFEDYVSLSIIKKIIDEKGNEK